MYKAIESKYKADNIFIEQQNDGDWDSNYILKINTITATPVDMAIKSMKSDIDDYLHNAYSFIGGYTYQYSSNPRYKKELESNGSAEIARFTMLKSISSSRMYGNIEKKLKKINNNGTVFSIDKGETKTDYYKDNKKAYDIVLSAKCSNYKNDTQAYTYILLKNS